MPAHRDGAAGTGAGVRKPPGKEPASGGARGCRECYGDFARRGLVAAIEAWQRRASAGWAADGVQAGRGRLRWQLRSCR